MRYFISENKLGAPNKGELVKNREDTKKILLDFGLQQININYTGDGNSFWDKIKRQKPTIESWKKATKKLKKGDSLFIQYPLVAPSYFLFYVFRKLYRKGIKIVLLVHDIDSLRWDELSEFKKKVILKNFAEDRVYKMADSLIVHNEKMKEELIRRGIKEEKMTELDCFDYLIPDLDKNKMEERNIGKNLPILVAGNLSNKAAYLYSLPASYRINMYGFNYTGDTSEAKKWKGAFSADELIYNLEGSFGLVWDGTSTETCSGGFGEYLKYNNPYKNSMYLAAEIPVIVWRQAAISKFVLENKCGIAVDSLLDIYKQIDSMTDSEYMQIKENTKEVGKKIREGYYLNKALNKIYEKY